MNTGASADNRTKSDNNATSQNLNFLEVNSNNQSVKSIDYFTPQIDIRKRGFAGSQMKRPIFNQNQQVESGENIISQSSDNIQSHQVLWGTSINVSEISSSFRSFLSNFRTREDELRGGDNFYVRQLSEISQTNIYLLNIDANHLNSFDKRIYNTLINYPSEMIPIMDNVTTSFYQEYCSQGYAELNPNIYIQVRINNLVSKSRIRDLGPQDIDKLISITGITIRNSEIIPEMREAFFRCSVCGKTETSLLTRSKIVEPNECKSCKSKFSFDLIHNRSVYSDKQHVKLQETPEHMPEGETPLTVHLCCYDELVDFVKPGDRCEIVGIFRAHGLRVNPKQRVTKSIYRTYIDVVSFTKQNKKKLNNAEQEDDAGNDLNEDFKEEVEKEVENLKKHPDIYNILVDSFAPSIWENEDIKKGLLLQIFGGVSKDFRDSGRGKFRGDINVLLVGDPSTAKSQLLQYVHNLAPRGIYTSGKGSSVVGLTAYVTKDPETREIVLESGALVLSDKGICCIDEFDKMDEDTRVILHEAMEQQTISIAKAGIICQLNTRTAILAAANPVNSKYDIKLSVVENIKLPPTLLSRFDLIYLMLDRHNDAYDRRLANHIVSLYGRFEDIREEQNKTLPKEILAAYISHARKINPVIQEDALKLLVNSYVAMRGAGSSKKTISATPRQLESIIRLSEAMARLRMSTEVEVSDVEEALRLMKVATQQAATDPVTGLIDMDLITTGMTTSSRNKLNTLIDLIKNLLREHSEQARKGVKFSSLSDEIKKKVDSLGTNSFTYSEFELRDSLRLLEDEGIISQMGNKKAPNIRLLEYPQ